MDSFYDLYVQEVAKNEKLDSKAKLQKIEILSLHNRIHYLENSTESSIQKAVDSAVAQVSKIYEDRIQKLNVKISHLESLLNIDSNNSGIPTSKTPISKEKRIPNSRVKTDKHIGGQTGHAKHKLVKFEDDEVTMGFNHKMRTCDDCGGKLINERVYTSKDELEFKVNVEKIRHCFYEYTCADCGTIIKSKIPLKLKEENQYGTNVQAIAITLMNQGYVSMNRTKEIINGLSHGEILISEGYIAKLQNRLAEELIDFMKEVKQEVIRLGVLHWDDTVIMIAKKQSCLRFYGNKAYALFTAHEKKDKKGLDEDGVLLLLGKDTVVMHDHNIINYNEDYNFQNAECCVHLIRDLQKVIDNLNHEWARNMIELITGSYHKRSSFLGLDVKQAEIDYDKELLYGDVENLDDKNAYYADTERALIKRMRKYKENYLMWMVNEEIPFSNNESERSLRSSKTKMKVSGQFQNIKSAENFAIIKSYIETGLRHGMNVQEIIKRALEGNYCTLEEMKSHEK